MDVTVSTTVVLVKNDPVAVIKIVSMENGTVALEALGSYDPDGGDITSFAWDFGDGSSAEGSSVTHTYAANGTYSVALTVKDDENATDASAVEIVIVIESEEEEPPTPDPDEKVGPPGLLRAIEDHTETIGRAAEHAELPGPPGREPRQVAGEALAVNKATQTHD